MLNRTRLATPVLLGALVVSGCSSKPAVYDGKVARHSIDDFGEAPQALFANQIPVYPGAKITDAMGSESWGDTPESYSEGMAWWFEVENPGDKVVAFYDGALPDAKRETGADGEVIWTLPPTGGRDGDEIAVIVQGEELRIRESVRGGRDRVAQSATSASD